MMRRFKSLFVGGWVLCMMLAACDGNTIVVTSLPPATATQLSQPTVAYINTLSTSAELRVDSGALVHTFTNQTPGYLSAVVDSHIYAAFDAPMVPPTTPRTVWDIDMQSGAVVWSHQTGPGISSAPVVGDGLVYIGSAQGALVALDAQTGTPKWQHTVTPMMGLVPYSPQIVFAGNTVYQVMADHIYAYDAQSGAPQWTAAVGGSYRQEKCSWHHKPRSMPWMPRREPNNGSKQRPR